MRPIPRTLLIHTVRAIKRAKADIWGSTEAESSRTIENVRVEPASSMRISRDNQQIQLSALLFYDCRNSVPADYKFSHGEEIEFDGNAYHVVNIDKCYDGRRLHHIEVGLQL